MSALPVAVRLASGAAALMIALLPAAPTVPAEPTPATFEQVWRTVRDRFFDPRLSGLDWQAVHDRYAAEAARATPTELSATINRMLGELKTSHTRFLSRDEPAYYQLLGVFQAGSWPQYRKLFGNQGLAYVDIGAFTRQVEGRTLVSAVLDDSPATQVGLRRGDELLAAGGLAGWQPVRAFAGREGKPTSLTVRRNGQPLTLTVTPRRYQPEKMFLEAMRASARVIPQDDARIGYIHVWSYAGDQYQALLRRELLEGRLRDADALVLDLRGGWGGAQPNYLSLFTARAPELTLRNRNRAERVERTAWTKPVVLLVDEDTRSGKEILAYGFRRYQIGPVVGARTAGAVVAGTAVLLDDGNLLYLAVADVAVDGERLEGKGVEPDIAVPMPVEGGGEDVQKQKALSVAADLVRGRRASEGRPGTN